MTLYPTTNVITEPLKDEDDFYISYNNRDIATYGSATTALVQGRHQMDKFYILNGDHRKAYSELINQGFSTCLKYFKHNIHLISKYSNRPLNKD